MVDQWYWRCFYWSTISLVKATMLIWCSDVMLFNPVTQVSSLMNKYKAKPNAREHLGAHVRSCEHADPIRGICVVSWVKIFWLDQHVQKTECVYLVLLLFCLFAHLFSSHLFLSKKPSGFQGTCPCAEERRLQCDTTVWLSSTTCP